MTTTRPAATTSSRCAPSAIRASPIEQPYADVYLWKNKATGTFFITMVNRLNLQDPNSPAHLEIKLLYGGEVHDQRYIVSVPPGLAERQGWYTVLRYNMTGRDERQHRERRVWQDYKFYMWWSAGATAATAARRRAHRAARQQQRRADHVRRAAISPAGSGIRTRRPVSSSCGRWTTPPAT